MNVRELIEFLKTINQEAIVLVDGYEDQFTQIDSVKTLKVEFKPSFDCYGDYVESSCDDNKAVDAVYLSRFVNSKS